MTMGRLSVIAAFILAAACALTPTAFGVGAGKYFAIQVVDDQTGRGVPLVELQTTNNILYHTDSNGFIAFYEPGLMDGRDVFFHVKSHGYEYPADGFGYRGVRLKPVEGGSATVKIRRLNIAQRLYRITGQGIYRDTLLLGKAAPTTQPALNGLVFGSDSVMTVEYKGKLFWFWGDTNWPAYPLGNFHMTGATSRFPSDGGLDPDAGVNLQYFTKENGFTREMAPFSKKGPTWADGYIVLKDEPGGERIYSSYANVNTKMETLERGLSVYNEEKEVFEKIADVPLDTPVIPGGHPFKHTVDGTEYVYFAHSLPFRRVKATPAAYRDLSSYEAFTCLETGSRIEDARIDRDGNGNIRYGWKRNTPVLAPQDERKLVEAGKLQPDEVLIHLRDADTGKAVLAHAGSCYWNAFRKRWIFVVCEIGGTSMLGETWYAEADTPLGPYCYARKIVTHDKYSFYNPKQHPQFAKDDGRTIYFEGTYTHTFSGNNVQTPRYDYNQVMYKLDLADPRMVLPVPVYTLTDPAQPAAFATSDNLPKEHKPRVIAFFAPDRPAPGLVAICRDQASIDAPIKSLAAKPAEQPAGDLNVLFYALPADAKEPPATTVPLFEYTRQSDKRKVWTTNDNWTTEGFTRAAQPLCRVWKSPTKLMYPLD